MLNLEQVRKKIDCTLSLNLESSADQGFGVEGSPLSRICLISEGAKFVLKPACMCRTVDLNAHVSLTNPRQGRIFHTHLLVRMGDCGGSAYTPCCALGVFRPAPPKPMYATIPESQRHIHSSGNGHFKFLLGKFAAILSPHRWDLHEISTQ